MADNVDCDVDVVDDFMLGNDDDIELVIVVDDILILGVYDDVESKNCENGETDILMVCIGDFVDSDTFELDIIVKFEVDNVDCDVEVANNFVLGNDDVIDDDTGVDETLTFVVYGDAEYDILEANDSTVGVDDIVVCDVDIFRVDSPAAGDEEVDEVNDVFFAK